jgi:hypothetical protein
VGQELPTPPAIELVLERALATLLQTTGGRGAVKSVHVKGSNSGSWIPMTNTWGAAWELSSAPAPPLDFKIVTDNGEEVSAVVAAALRGGT